MVNPKQLLHFYLISGLKRAEIYLLVFCALMVVAARQTTEADTKALEAKEPTTEMLSKADSLLLIAASLQGVPYRFAGKQPSGFDCSGFTRYVYSQVGLSIGASAQAQFQQGSVVPVDDYRPGDLVFFTSRQKINHVGIITHQEDDQTYFIHASTSRGVVTDCLQDSYFQEKLAGLRRLLP